MRNPVTMPTMAAPPVGRVVQKIIDIHPAAAVASGSVFQTGSPPRTLIDPPGTRDESVEAKWEQLQYYEAKSWATSDTANPNAEISMSSTGSNTSGLSSNSTSGSHNGTGSSSNATDKIRKKLRKMKQSSLKKFTSGLKLFNVHNASANSGTSPTGTGSRFPGTGSRFPGTGSWLPGGPEVSHAPGGVSQMLPRLRASKSMQNLEQITRDSIYNLKDVTSNLRQKYNSRMELRQRSQLYSEFWDEDEFEHVASGDENERVEFRDLASAVTVPHRYNF